MPLTLVLNNTKKSPALAPEGSIQTFAHLLLQLTQNTTHTHEYTVHRLLIDLQELLQTHKLSLGEYSTIIGKAADVAAFFHYDIQHLCSEPNNWYRASLIHQLGQGMLQAIERLRADLPQQPFFTEAMAGLGMGRSNTANGATPLTCRHWAHDLPPYMV